MTFGCTAAEDFFSAPVAWGAAAGGGWAALGLALLGVSFVVATVGATIGPAIGAGALEFGVRLGVKGDALLLGVLLARLLVRLLVMANPVSGALAVCAAAVVVALDERAWAGAGAVSRVAAPDVGAGSAAGLPGLELPGVELPTLVSLALRAAGCFVFGSSVTGAKLLSLTGDCGVGAGVGTEDVSGKMLEAGLGGELGLGCGLTRTRAGLRNYQGAMMAPLS